MLVIDPIVQYASSHYTNHNCVGWDEFYSDYSIVIQIKKLLTRYKNTGDIRERLLINHFISFFNVFENHAALRILFSKIDSQQYPQIVSTLEYLGRLPTKPILKINGEILSLNTIKKDLFLLGRLQDV